MLFLLLACREDEPGDRPARTETGGPTTGDTGDAAPIDAPCDGRGEGEGACVFALSDADRVLTGVPLSVLEDLGGDGHDDLYRIDRESGGSYHSTWRDYTLVFWPNVLDYPDLSVTVRSRASVTRTYYGTDTGVQGVRWTPDATGDGVPDAWFRLPAEWALVAGPVGRSPGDPATEAVATVADLSATTDTDHDGVAEIVRGDVSVRCEGPFSGEVGEGCTEPGYTGSTYPWGLRQADADLDGDGHDDSLVVDLLEGVQTTEGLYSPTLVVRGGDPRATWMEPVSQLPLGTPLEGNFLPLSRADDLDADGVGDLVWVDPISAPDEARVHRGPLPPVLAFATAEVTIRAMADIAALGMGGDIEGDGVPELLLQVGTPDDFFGVHLMHATESGTLYAEERSYVIARGDRIDGAATADLDGDGKTDVLVAQGEQIHVFLGSTLSAR